MSDIRFAFRNMCRRPGFTVAAVTTLALGIGASTAIFSVAYGVSLRPLSYPEPDRLLRVYEANPSTGSLKENVSLGAFHAWRGRGTSIESAALFTRPRARFLAGPDEYPVTTMGVSPAFFSTLGVRPILGVGFKPEHEYTRSTIREVVLSFAAWRRMFGGDGRVIGRAIRFADDDDAFQIVGVMPETFVFLEPVDVWQPKIVELPIASVARSWRYDRVIARLRPGMTIDRARAELEGVAARLAEEFPVNHGGWTVAVESLHDSVVGNFGRATWLLLATVVVVLLVTCLNVGGLLVARAAARDRETAVRAALGAGSWPLLRLWLAEATLVSGLGAGGGLLLSWFGVSALKAAAPPGIPRLDAIAIDLPTLAVAAFAALLAMVVFTAAPAGRQWRDLASRLRASSVGAAEPCGRQATYAFLTLAQCAGAAALVVLAVLLTRSFVRLMSPDSSPSTVARGRGQIANDDTRWPAAQHNVTDGFFALMGIRLLGGRTFGPDDRFAEPYVNRTEKAERGVVVVSASTARTLWPGKAAIGQVLWLPGTDNVTWREVVGVVEDIQFHAVGEMPALHVFIPWTQQTTGRPRLLIRSTRRSGIAIADVARDVVRSVEPGTRIDQMTTLDALVRQSTAQQRFTSSTVSMFGGLALVLAAAGIHGTLAYLVSLRTREIGIRLALGATRGRIARSILARALGPATAGGIVGLGLAVSLARAFRALLFDLQPLDPGSFVGGATLLLLAALAAAMGPALRASSVDPAQALRTE